MRQPLVSVVMPAYNAASFIETAIDSVLRQTYANLELVVVDDGSTDATPRLAEAYGDRLVCFRQRNARQAAARNRGALESSGELIAFIDADDEWLPRKLEKQVRLLDAHPECGLVLCGVQEVDRNGGPLRARQIWFHGDPCEAIPLGEAGGGICGSTPVIRRSVFEELGGFDEALPPCEDTDLIWRYACCGKLEAVEEVLVHYRLHDCSAHGSLDLMIPAWRRFYRKVLASDMASDRGPLFRARCRGRLSYMLAGDYAKTGAYLASLRCAAAAALQWPPFALRILRQLARIQRV
jgi:glycosyltransferase involved in cell wall biosynthesis